MTISALLVLALAAADPVVEDLGGDRYRITVSYRGDSPELIGRMLIRLGTEAQRLCGRRGRAVSSGRLELGAGAGGRRRLSEIYTCTPAPAAGQ